MRLILALLAAFAAAAVSPAAAQAQAQTRTLSLDHDGLTRRAILDAAPGVQDAPVLVILHGGIAGPEWMRRRARVGLAREGWAVLYPYAIDDWNDGRLDRRGRRYDDADDLGFLRALIARLDEAGIADPSRVFFAGPSLGGTMVLRILCEAPELGAGYAVAISSFPEGEACRDEDTPRPVLLLHGTADRIMPPEGGRVGGGSLFVKDRGRVRPVAETAARLADRNGCEGFDERAIPDRVTSDESTAALREYQGCEQPFLHYVVEGAGHTWPGSGQLRLGGSLIGMTNQDFSATRVVERFFKALAATPEG
ncbi:MAG: hypothetical protein AAFU61_01780 [Pseudomonadota bacterium]